MLVIMSFPWFLLLLMKKHIIFVYLIVWFVSAAQFN
jgi:hypothetical protein